MRNLVTDLAEEMAPEQHEEVLTRLRLLDCIGRAVQDVSDSEMMQARETPSGSLRRGRHTWAEIGSALGISSQAARQRAERRNRGPELWEDPSASRRAARRTG